jgi:hypothetical protein
MAEQSGPLTLTEEQLAQVIDEDELYDDDDEDDFEDEDDEEDDLDDDDEDFEDDDEDDEDDEEELSGGGEVEAIYEEADLLLDEFQDYLRDEGLAREERVNYDETLQSFVDDYLAAYEVGKLTDMTRDEIDTYVREFLLERERISKRKLTEIKQALCAFYAFLAERGHMPQAITEPIVQFCQR